MEKAERDDETSGGGRGHEKQRGVEGKGQKGEERGKQRERKRDGERSVYGNPVANTARRLELE